MLHDVPATHRGSALLKERYGRGVSEQTNLEGRHMAVVGIRKVLGDVLARRGKATMRREATVREEAKPPGLPRASGPMHAAAMRASQARQAMTRKPMMHQGYGSTRRAPFGNKAKY